MINIVAKEIEAYAESHSTPVPQLFEDLKTFTEANTNLPQMQVGPIEGNFLRILAAAIGAKRILEVGTFTGYSTLMMAGGLPKNGEVITCDIDPETAEMAAQFFTRSPHGHKITQRLGPASATIAQLEGPFDMAFIDADKQGYRGYFCQIVPLMRTGGLILVDNVLWDGRVLDPDSASDESTKHLAAFNRFISEHESIDRVMLTIRDGMTMVLVTQELKQLMKGA